jgi:hypothetical protein
MEGKIACAEREPEITTFLVLAVMVKKFGMANSAFPQKVDPNCDANLPISNDSHDERMSDLANTYNY